MTPEEERLLHKAVGIDSPQGTEIVDIIACKYEWLCPRCSTENNEIEHTTVVTCGECGISFLTGLPEHAYGK